MRTQRLFLRFTSLLFTSSSVWLYKYFTRFDWVTSIWQIVIITILVTFAISCNEVADKLLDLDMKI